MNLTKILMVVVPAGAIASFAIPMYLEQQQRSSLAKEFGPVLQRYDRVNISAGDKKGKLSWPDTVASLDPSELPTIPGGVLVMEQSARIVTGTRWEDRPAKLHESFFEIDDDLRAASPEDVRTLVYAKTHYLTKEYEAEKVAGVRRILNQKVVQLNIYDLEQRVCVGTWVLAGEPPPNSFQGDNQPRLAPPPSAAEFLDALPRR
ncbi:MAG: hypothetical protein ACYTGW_12210 [Planctomycetota bacterium]|jgi:hypothetical protein